MRRAARTDANQDEIVATLREAGAQVQVLSGVGCGFPDVAVVAPDGRTFLVEIKDGAKPPSERKLTDDERKFHKFWRGELHIVTNPDEARACLVRR